MLDYTFSQRLFLINSKIKVPDVIWLLRVLVMHTLSSQGLGSHLRLNKIMTFISLFFLLLAFTDQYISVEMQTMPW